MKAQATPARHARVRTWLLTVIAVVMVGWALRATGSFMVPVVFSMFLALLVAPLDRRVARRLPDRISWLGHVVAVGAILATLLIFVGLVWFSAQQVVERFPSSSGTASMLPRFGQELQDALAGPGDGGGTTTHVSPREGDGTGFSLSRAPAEIARQVGQALSGSSVLDLLGGWASRIAMSVLGAASGMLFATILVIFLTLMMLIERANWSQKFAIVLSGQSREDAMETVAVIADLMRRYLITRTVLGATTALLYVGWLWLFGIDLLVVWALLAFLLNYIPTLGSLVAGALPVLYAVVQKDAGTALAIGAGIFAIEQVMGNYVDPRVQGRQVSLSSLVVLITLLVWGWIWGMAGTILAVPITIATMIICAHVEPLRPFALLLSDTRDYQELDRQARR